MEKFENYQFTRLPCNTQIKIQKKDVLLQQNSKPMEDTYRYTKYSEMAVEMHSQENSDLHVLRGRALLNSAESRITFVQNPPRVKRSKVLDRGKHTILRQQIDGKMLITMRFDNFEEYITSQLVAELRNVMKCITKNQ